MNIDSYVEEMIIVEGWRDIAPMTKSEREKVAKKKRGCFLLIKKNKNGETEYKFPICDKRGNVKCEGLLAAFRRARQHGYRDVALKAIRKAKRNKCSWADKYNYDGTEKKSK